MKKKIILYAHQFITYLNNQKILLISILFVLFFITLAYYQMVTVERNFSFTEQLYYWSNGNAAVKYDFLHFFQLGLWDSYSGLGYPLMAHLSSQFYPFTFLGFFIPDFLVSLKIQVFFHFLLAGLACFYLLRVLKCSTLASVLGSVAYLTNDYILLVAYRGFLSETYNLVWMPLSLAFFWQAIFSKKRFFAVFTGITLAMHVISMSLYSLYFTYALLFFLAMFAVLYKVIVAKENLFATIKELLYLVIFASITFFGFSAIKLLPVLEYSKLSVRSYYSLYGDSRWELLTPQMVVQYVVNFLIPISTIPFKYSNSIWVAWIADLFFLILIFLAIGKRSKEVFFLAVVTAISLWATLGHNAPIDIYALFYHIIPGLNTIAYTYRFKIITNLTIPILASFGLSYIQKKFNNKLITVVLLFLILLPPAIYVRNYLKYQVRDNHEYKVFSYQKDNIFNYQLSQLVSKEKYPVHIYSAYRLNFKSVFNYSALVFNFNLTNSPHELFDLTYQHFLNYWDKNIDSEFLRKKYKLMQLMNAKYVVSLSSFDDYPNSYLQPVFVYKKNSPEDGSIYEVRSYLPYIGVKQQSILLIGKNNFNDFNAFEAKVLVLDKAFDLQNTTVFTSSQEDIHRIPLSQLGNFDAIIFSEGIPNDLQTHQIVKQLEKQQIQIIGLNFIDNHYNDLMERSDSIMTTKPAKSLGEADHKQFLLFLQKLQSENSNKNADITIVKNTPEYLQFTVHTTGHHIPIQLAQTYYPGWRAYIDGNEVPLYMADGMVTGFFINTSGTHTVVLKFQPVIFYIGVTVTFFTIIVLLWYFYNLRMASKSKVKHSKKRNI